MFENILYATDFTESPFMLPCVGVIGKTKKIHLLHVADEGIHIDPQLFEPRMAEAKNFLEETLNVERNRGVEVDVHLMPGVPAREICDVARRVDASLVVVNYHMPEGAGGSATMELIRNCDRNVLVMTRLASEAVDRAGEAMDQYCTNLFRRVVCPAAGEASARIRSLEALKNEVSMGTVIFSSFSENDRDRAEILVRGVKAAGIDARHIVKKGLPAGSLISSAEEADASLILLDRLAELGLALAVVGASNFPVLVLKSP
ncbi:MAG TPA: universal stress protein [Methanocella sp.]|nr:universal stress protein [Methanocella sp.]